MTDLTHINDKGEFQSDRYPDLPPDKIVLSFKNPKARRALRLLASLYQRRDPQLSKDIETRLRTIKEQADA